MLKHYPSKKIVAGCDEAGRGCLAGPVYAAAVILPKGFQHDLLNDSKKLTEKTRLELEVVVKEKAIAYAIAKCSPKEIDKYNILWASVRAMHKAVKKLSQKPELLLIDGNRFRPYSNITHECVIGGDGIFLSIAAASILAKTARDKHMKRLSKKYPSYMWGQNKGYPTLAHREAIKSNGPTEHHRKSFRLLRQGIQGDLF